MRTQLATYALAGALGLSGVAGAALVAPAVSYAATGDSTALDARVTSLKQALTGLVSGGSITQAQADEVATTLAEARPEGFGRGGRGGGGRIDMAAAAEAVTAGRLTQAEADARATDLEARVTDSLDELCGPGGRGRASPDFRR
jgi:hypothetical protein